MSSPAEVKLTASQLQSMRQTLRSAHEDLDYVLRPVVAQMLTSGMDSKAVLPVLRDAARRSLYLTATDCAASFDVDIPESAAARDTLVYKLVDAEAARFARLVLEAAQPVRGKKAA
ncbi:MAG TPA: hypothetical protein VNX66_03950 [Candidatus Sulfotelmatobacter sp.]|jgi:hypothetical protein|nr:hypothetical protein [Candidatus Sulfotelmatobacter sp.]